MDLQSFMMKLYASACAVEICRQLEKIVFENCCGCIKANYNDCLMLSEKEKLQLYYEQAESRMDLIKVKRILVSNMEPFHLTKRKVNALKEALPEDPRNEDYMRKLIKEFVTTMYTF